MFIGFQGDYTAEMVEVNEDGIIFCDGLAYFTDTNDKDYTIETKYIMQIINNVNF